MAKASKIKMIQDEILKARQSLTLHQVFEMKGHKLSISIKSDSYDFQSHAIISVFHPTELKWNRLAGIHHSTMKTPHELAYWPEAQSSKQERLRPEFELDRAELVKLADQLL
jgi:hypothetical protein